MPRPGGRSPPVGATPRTDSLQPPAEGSLRVGPACEGKREILNGKLGPSDACVRFAHRPWRRASSRQVSQNRLRS